MRGQNAILSLLPSAIDPKPEQKGHRNVHIDRRDDALAARFYWYYHLKRLRYDDILVKLENEFFLTPNVIIQRLNERTDYIKELSQSTPKTKALKSKFPLFTWY